MKQGLFAFRRFLAQLMLPYFRLELPGWERMASLVGLPIKNHALWAGAKARTIRGKYHGLRMRLEMQDWCERLSYFLGRYYEITVELVTRALVARGETYIDVGGNIGMVTLIAAACVGEVGKVFAFEPNPNMARRIEEAIELNGLRNVTVYPLGLSDKNSTLELTTVRESTGWSTFGNVSEKDASLTYSKVIAQVNRADDVLPATIHGAVTVKVDVEGYECHVMRGMIGFIERLHPAVITEVDPRLLKMADSSEEELFGIMHRLGYVGYGVHVEKRGLRYELVLRDVRSPSDRTANNVVWVYPGSIQQGRLSRFVAKPYKYA